MRDNEEINSSLRRVSFRKDALVKLLLEKYPETFHRKVSYTTRKPRPGELNGKDYHFVTREEFFNLIMTEQMIEAAEIGGKCTVLVSIV